ncbi:hypothetical protein TWF696_006515 [Orbilia brochopaga]|uniref:Uncharacterized protein n=1 Tax=Orbilia brochopaga TaxID=3140254 RepID=A0AAV9UWJ5_9PEZI
MKVSVQFFAAFLLAATSVSAGPLGRRAHPGESGVSHPESALAAPVAAAASPFPTLKPSPTEGTGEEEAEEEEELEKRQNPNFNPKEGFIRGAQRSGANSTQIAFLQGVPEETFQKLFTMDRKINQAFRALNNLTVPDLAALPTNNPNPPNRTRPPRPTGTGSQTRPPRPTGTSGARRPRRTPKEAFIRFAQRKGVSAEQLAALQARPDADFEFKGLGIKETFVKESTLLGDNARLTFFQNTVPQALYDELTKLEDTARAAFKSLRNGVAPTL